MSLASLFFWKMDSQNSQEVKQRSCWFLFFVLNSHSNAISSIPQHIHMCRPACPKWEYFVSLLSRILNASDGEEKVFWLVERILWCARCTSETRTRVPLHSTASALHLLHLHQLLSANGPAVTSTVAGKFREELGLASIRHLDTCLSVAFRPMICDVERLS